MRAHKPNQQQHLTTLLLLTIVATPICQPAPAIGEVVRRMYLRKTLLCVLPTVFTILAFTCTAAIAASGPQSAWNVFILPNPQVTPAWRTYAPPDCASDPDACAQDHRFWEEWDFSNFRSAIDTSFAAVNSQGQYQAVMLILPLSELSNATSYRSNIQIMYTSANSHGVQLEFVLFPKWKYGAEYCYLYELDAPSGCQLLSGTSSAVAYQKLLELMTFVENLGTSCSGGSFNRPFAIWYGWSDYDPGYGQLKNFWLNLPMRQCNLQAAYITWLDTGFVGNPDVKRLQWDVVKRLNLPYWVNTELYSTAQLQQYGSIYAPFQTIITGFWEASDPQTWAQGMCGIWQTASTPTRLGVWTFYDRDVSPFEEYRSYFPSTDSSVRTMAAIAAICSSDGAPYF